MIEMLAATFRSPVSAAGLKVRSYLIASLRILTYIVWFFFSETEKHSYEHFCGVEGDEDYRANF